MKNYILLIILLLFTSLFIHKADKPTDIPNQNTTPSPPQNTYTYIDHTGKTFNMTLQEGAIKSTFNTDRLSKKDSKYEYYSSEGNLISHWGIDVSSFQGDINWKKVRDAGIEFVIIRVGYRGYGAKGTLALDRNFKQNIEGARAVGLDVGVYFFSQAISDEEALEEANFVIENIKEYNITYPVIIDTEEIDPSRDPRTKDITSEQVTRNCIIFCNKINEAGYNPMIYYNLPWCESMLNLKNLNSYDIWFADYTDFPQSPYKFSMWQYSQTGKIDGISGNVDLNLYIGGK